MKIKSLLKQSVSDLNKNFIYYLPCVDIEGNDLYICTCGNSMTVSPNQTTYMVNEDSYLHTEESENLHDILRDKKIVSIICDKCQQNFSEQENSIKIQNLNFQFYEKYNIENDSNFTTLIKIRGGMYQNNIDGTKIKKPKIEYSYIRINKKTKKIYIKQFSDEKHKQIKLSTLIANVLQFFQKNKEVSYSDGYINIHDWIGRIAILIRDSKNMNIIDDLMTLMVGKSGIDILEKTSVILLSIILYPNLSTISLTKGNIFLFDLIFNCPLPDAKKFKEKELTSPLKIFNFLISIKNKKIQKELDGDDKNKIEYTYKSLKDNIIKNLNLKKSNIFNENEVVKKNNGKVFVRDEIKNKRISPYIFNKLQKYSEYEELIQWLRFISYENLIELVKKYPIEFLVSAYKQMEFRDDLNFDRIKQFLTLMLSYCVDVFQLESSEQVTNFSPVKSFNFNLYDDCFRMLVELNWSPNKVLYKIKDYRDFSKFHSNLIKHRSFISNSEANDRFVEFSNKFKFLETYSSDLDINLKINLINTPMELMNQAVDMHNCAGSYIRRVSNGEYIAFIVYDNSPNKTSDEFYKYMMVLEITPLGLEFVGIKSKYNKYGSNRFKEEVKKYLIDKDISFQDVPSIKTDIQSNEPAYDGVFENILKKENL